MNKIMYSLLAGVVIGLLIAPDKGSETLKRVRSRFNDYKDQAEDQADELAGKARKAFSKGRDAVNDTLA
jgi:gas vesicle protein